MSSKDNYVDKIHTLFQKYFPGKYDRSYVANLLKANKGKEKEVYDQFVDQFKDLVVPNTNNNNSSNSTDDLKIEEEDETDFDASKRGSVIINDDIDINAARTSASHRKGGLSSIIAKETKSKQQQSSNNNNNNKSGNTLKPGGNSTMKRKSKHAVDLQNFEKFLTNIEKGILMNAKLTSKLSGNNGVAATNDNNNNNNNNSPSDTLNTPETKKALKKRTSSKSSDKDDSSSNNNNNNKKKNESATSENNKNKKKKTNKRSSGNKNSEMNEDGDSAPFGKSNNNNNGRMDESMQDSFAQAIRQMKHSALTELNEDKETSNSELQAGTGLGGNNNKNDEEYRYSSVNVVIRIRPTNWMEMEHETRLLFKVEFDMDDKDWEIFNKERQLLIDKHWNELDSFDILSYNVENVCEWLESIKLDGYKARVRRKKVNGEWLLNIPRYLEKKPLEIDINQNYIVAFRSHDQSHKYEFDCVLNDKCDNNFVYNKLGNGIIDNLLNGYNVTIFAYGQTGTGKTFTMFGDDYDVTEENKDGGGNESDSESESDDDGAAAAAEVDTLKSPKASSAARTPRSPRTPQGGGAGGGGAGYNIKGKAERKNELDMSDEELNRLGIIPRTLMSLFSEFEKSKEIAFFNVQIAIMEIYCEKLRDLIRPRMKLTLRYVGQNSKVDNLTYLDINSAAEALEVIDKSKKHRVTAETKQNLTSSRSHCIIVVKIDSTLNNGTQQSSTLTFGDLAGSEKISKTGAKNQRLREAKKIVQSLFALKKTIRALANNEPFVPYQESVLTKLLRDSIGGNSKTTIIVTGTAHEYNRSETLSTLRFAEMAKKIQNDATVNRLLSRDEMESQIHALQEQLQYLRKQKAKKSRFTSTDFRVLQRQLFDAANKAEEFQSKFLNAEIQLLVKTQYIQEVESIIEKKDKQLTNLRDSFVMIKKLLVDEKNKKNKKNNNNNGKTNEKILKILNKIDTSDMDQKAKVSVADMKTDDDAGNDYDYESSSDGD